MKFFPLIFSLAQICLMAGAAQAQAPLPEAGIPLPGEFLPPPPAVEGLEFQRDQAIFWQTRAERDSDRWRQAIYDAADEKHLEDLYLAAFGLKINTRRTPATLALLRFVDQYLAASINSAKDQYKRIRPFAFFNMSGKTCTPYDEVWLSWNGAYPSGHSARGWGRALVLAELSPERQSAILKRGYELGQSRVICGVHWQSDVDSARLAASAAVVQMHNTAEFLGLLEKARAEIQDLRKFPRPGKRLHMRFPPDKRRFGGG